MNDLISRQVALKTYQKVCNGIVCKDCPFLFHVSPLITDCKLEMFLHELPNCGAEMSERGDDNG